MRLDASKTSAVELIQVVVIFALLQPILNQDNLWCLAPILSHLQYISNILSSKKNCSGNKGIQYSCSKSRRRKLRKYW
uniref:Uncharacterized protein n=1 Tax=Physcomitrium patens TaxID=3218 RepID=A0A2K1LBA3_PHYPA|nr:hypothetical protein PHYPA_001731 [Physcomitrium patens]